AAARSAGGSKRRFSWRRLERVSSDMGVPSGEEGVRAVTVKVWRVTPRPEGGVLSSGWLRAVSGRCEVVRTSSQLRRSPVRTGETSDDQRGPHTTGGGDMTAVVAPPEHP